MFYSIWVGQQVLDEDSPTIRFWRSIVFGWVCVYLLKTYRYVMKTPRLLDIGVLEYLGGSAIELKSRIFESLFKVI